MRVMTNIVRTQGSASSQYVGHAGLKYLVR